MFFLPATTEEKYSLRSDVFIYSRLLAKHLCNCHTSMALNDPGCLIALAIVWKKKTLWHLEETRRNPKRGLNQGIRRSMTSFRGKRLLACREGTSEIKIWTERLWEDNCSFFFARHSAGSWARGYSDEQKELGVVTSHIAEDRGSADDNDVSRCWRPQPASPRPPSLPPPTGRRSVAVPTVSRKKS